LSTRDQELVRGVVAGDGAATRELVARLLDVVTREVGLVLLRRAAPTRRDPRQERDDLAQDVLVALLADRAQELARWDPARGRSLDSFVQLITRRRVVRILSGGRGNPWSADPVAPDDIEELHEGAARDVEELEARNELASVLGQLHGHMSDRDAELFELVFVEERAPEEVCEQMSMTRAALNTWRHRLRKLAKQLADQALRPTRRAGGAP
jgi:RNA polymerase sigma-70 factor (ECF subfamily)